MGPIGFGFYVRIAYQRMATRPRGPVHSLHPIIIPPGTSVMTAWDLMSFRSPPSPHIAWRWIMKGVARELAERPRTYVAITHAVRDDLHDILGVPLARIRVAERARKAATAERLPSLAFNADYGDIGIAPGVSHGTLTVAGTLKIPIFQGGKVRGDVLQADAILKQRQSELEDLRARIDYQVRTALMDLRTAAEQVSVAKSSLELANATVTQAQDRFAAGVVDNLEVVEAQESVANANEAYISSLYAHNVAKVLLARAMGVAQEAVSQFLGSR